MLDIQGTTAAHITVPAGAKVVASGHRWAVVAEDGTRTLWPTRAKARAYARRLNGGRA